jgi:hypothetical protein
VAVTRRERNQVLVTRREKAGVVPWGEKSGGGD